MSSKYSYKRLGDYIVKCEGRNNDLRYGLEDVLGVNNEGKIVKSKAKLHGVDLSPYKIVLNNNFVYNPARLDLGSISLYIGDGCVVSTLYVVFKVRDDKKDEHLTEYLDLWLQRKEFHRYVGYINWGSAREYFWYDNIAEVMLPVPPIAEQRRIVSEYQAVERRIKNNEALIQKLEETAQAIYHHTFVEGIDENNLPEGWRMGCLGEVCEVITKGTTPNNYVENSKINFIKGESISDNHRFIDSAFSYIDEETHNHALRRSKLEVNDILITIAGTLGKYALLTEDILPANTNQAVSIIRISNFYSPYFVYGQLLGGVHVDYCKRNIQQAVQANYSLATISNIPIYLPGSLVMQSFGKKIEYIIKYQKLIERELHHLRKLQSLLTSKLA